MSVNNIVNMAMIKELELMAITDHNSMNQLHYLKEICQNKIDFIYGVELQTKEEIHVLGYFLEEECLTIFQAWIDDHLIVIENMPDFFGHQYVYDKKDQVESIENRLLISSLNTSLEETIQAIHEYKGIVVLAHVLDKRYSVFENLGFIPEDLDIEGIEVKSDEQIEIVKKRAPHLKNVYFFRNSDAHQLIDINEAVHTIDKDVFYSMWR